jgi:hypothetical protein
MLRLSWEHGLWWTPSSRLWLRMEPCPVWTINGHALVAVLGTKLIWRPFSGDLHTLDALREYTSQSLICIINHLLSYLPSNSTLNTVTSIQILNTNINITYLLSAVDLEPRTKTIMIAHCTRTWLWTSPATTCSASYNLDRVQLPSWKSLLCTRPKIIFTAQDEMSHVSSTVITTIPF